MSLFKEHKEGNDHPFHSKIKKSVKRIAIHKMRARLKRILKKELNEL